MDLLEITDIASLKRWFAMYLNIGRELECQSDRLKLLEEKLGTVGTPNFSGMPSNPSPTNDRKADVVASIIDLQNEVHQLYEYHDKLTKQIEWCVKLMNSPEERLIIRARYIDGADWREITKILFSKKEDYSDKLESYMRRMYLLHGSALKNFVNISSGKKK